MQPQFKPMKGKQIILNNQDWFWVMPDASHISFKNGETSFWILLNPEKSGDGCKNYRSTNNRRFVKKEGNCFFLPGFKHSIGNGYCYNPICWEWRCRSCHRPVFSRHLLDSLEVCHTCRTLAFMKKRLPPS